MQILVRNPEEGTKHGSHLEHHVAQKENPAAYTVYIVGEAQVRIKLNGSIRLHRVKVIPSALHNAQCDAQ